MVAKDKHRLQGMLERYGHIEEECKMIFGRFFGIIPEEAGEKVNQEEFGPIEADKWLFLAFLPSCQSNVLKCHYRNKRLFRYLTVTNCNKRSYAVGPGKARLYCRTPVLRKHKYLQSNHHISYLTINFGHVCPTQPSTFQTIVLLALSRVTLASSCTGSVLKTT